MISLHIFHHKKKIFRYFIFLILLNYDIFENKAYLTSSGTL